MKEIKFTRNELEHYQDESINIDEDIVFDSSWFVEKPLIIETKNLHISGKIKHIPSTELYEVNMNVDGIMVCPCSITNEPVDIDINVDYQDTMTFEAIDNEDEEFIILDEEYFDLIDYLFERICLEAPLSVVKKGKIQYPSGDGWRVLSEREYDELKNQEGDSRLAILKQFKFENENN